MHETKLLRTIRSRRPLERWRNALAAIASAIVVLPALPQAANAWTLTITNIAVTVPDGCRPAKPDPRATFRVRCLEQRSDGSRRIVTLDEMLAGPVNGKAPSKSNWVDLVMNDFFLAFVRSSVAGSQSHSVKAAVVPASRLSSGFSACKSYTIDQRGDGVLARERGLFCADWAAGEPVPVLRIAAVADLYEPSRGQALPSDSDAAATRILATFRVK